jgi:hypothetical protein
VGVSPNEVHTNVATFDQSELSIDQVRPTSGQIETYSKCVRTCVYPKLSICGSNAKVQLQKY